VTPSVTSNLGYLEENQSNTKYVRVRVQRMDLRTSKRESTTTASSSNNAVSCIQPLAKSARS
jgi:hypothetical protein